MVNVKKPKTLTMAAEKKYENVNLFELLESQEVFELGSNHIE